MTRKINIFLKGAPLLVLFLVCFCSFSFTGFVVGGIFALITKEIINTFFFV